MLSFQPYALDLIEAANSFMLFFLPAEYCIIFKGGIVFLQYWPFKILDTFFSRKYHVFAYPVCAYVEYCDVEI